MCVCKSGKGCEGCVSGKSGLSCDGCVSGKSGLSCEGCVSGESGLSREGCEDKRGSDWERVCDACVDGGSRFGDNDLERLFNETK